MTTRSSTKTVVFAKPFHLKVVGRTLPAGPYEITTEEEQIEYLSFPAYRRVATVILVPTKPGSASLEMFHVDPLVLEAAQARDAEATAAADSAPPTVGPDDESWPAAPTVAREAAGTIPPPRRSNAARASAGLSALRSSIDNARRWLIGGARL